MCSDHIAHIHADAKLCIDGGSTVIYAAQFMVDHLSTKKYGIVYIGI